MNRDELKAEIARLNGLLAQRQNALLSNDGTYRDLLAQLAVRKEWLESLNGKGDNPDDGVEDGTDT